MSDDCFSVPQRSVHSTQRVSSWRPTSFENAQAQHGLGDCDRSADGLTRLSQSWHSGTPRRGFVAPLVRRAQSFTPQVEDTFNSSRVFGGIERCPRPVLPSNAERAVLNSFSEAFQHIYNEKPHVVAFVNSRSGGQTGKMLLRTLTESIGQDGADTSITGQVCDLSHPDEPSRTIAELAAGLDGATSSGLQPSGARSTRLLICGGDGTVTWILTALENCQALHGKFHLLPVAIVPLGTGNDLSRSLGWGSRLRAVCDVLKYLQWVPQATPVSMDQWRIVLRPHGELPGNHKLRQPGSHPQLVADRALAQQLLEDVAEVFADHEQCGVVPDAGDEVYLGFWQNYFSIGLDARVAGYVDLSRNSTALGRTCFRKGCGKLCYAWQAARHGFGASLLSRVMGSDVMVEPPDESRRPLDPTDRLLNDAGLQKLDPPLTERNLNCGLRGRFRQFMLLNINSYGSGLNVLPPGRAGVSVQPSPRDGTLEVLALSNALSSLGVFARISLPTYVTSTGRIAFRLSAGEWMQLDGEPWRLDVGCDLIVEPHRKVTMLCAPAMAPFWCGHCRPDFWSAACG